MLVIGDARRLQSLLQLCLRFGRLAGLIVEQAALVADFGEPLYISESLIEPFGLSEGGQGALDILFLAVEYSDAKVGCSVLRITIDRLDIILYGLFALVVLLIRAPQIDVN